ncbi:MAG TPA: Gmad2 immunoglobulin-like domain-containing protein [Candidatus Limnocylindrales bacterium]|nr:Gmad2 immunoglobulin-like domain-containing protein [Candidatus Limnocylindrales bacterium]
MTASRDLTGALARTLALIVVASLALACAPSSGVAGPIATPGATTQPSVVQSPDATAPTSATPGPSASVPASGSAPPAQPSATPVPSGTTIVRAYLFGMDIASFGSFPYHLVPVLRTVPETKGVARAAMTQLLASGSTGLLGSQIPTGTSLLGISIDESGVATVDLSSRFAGGGTASSQIARAAQVVYTLTQFSNVNGVLILVEGEPLAVPDAAGLTHTNPVRRADYRELLPAIFVDRPAYEAAIGNPARVAGLANVFEATFRVRLIDGAGRTLVDRQAMASCGSGCWGTFDVTLPYSVGAAQWGTLRVYDRSARDGSPENVNEYRVWLTPD